MMCILRAPSFRFAPGPQKLRTGPAWYGICIRVISQLFTAVAFMLFHRSGLSAGDHHYNRTDVVITYVLLGGAVMLEMVSVLRTLFSRWPSITLGKMAYEEGRCHMWVRLACAIGTIRRLILPERAGSRWWWSNSIGQHNMIDMCVGSKANLGSKIACWMGIEDWWNTRVYSSSIPVSITIKEAVLEQVASSLRGRVDEYFIQKSVGEDLEHIINSRGLQVLHKWGVYERLIEFVNMEFDQSIVVWHIATDIYLHWHKDQGKAVADDVHRLAEATQAISNYMLFLLAKRPYMLPGSVGRTRYVDMCYSLIGMKYSTAKELVSLLTSSNWLQVSDSSKQVVISDNRTLHAVIDLARELTGVESSRPAVELKMIAQVWLEMLCYAGYRCSGYSHAKQLSNGGELLTVVALVVEYHRRNIMY
ncbi:hypothetical protein CFC21_026854 [Triticum aestivum]|uniref:DUF4220 domain-containing protein n=2 Tax=Triticum aestivum TaxID=4565 RepID=A0A3B6CHK1_WHEAT|nr:hypothetical protein CFC21_026854 [Triticum aestivum]